MLDTNVWITVGFTYDVEKQNYYLIVQKDGYRLCLACTIRIDPIISAFCSYCKASSFPDWTTGNGSLDSLIMKSWNSFNRNEDGYIQWIKFSQLTNMQKASSLDYGCTHVADWLDPTTGKLIKVILKKIVDGKNFQQFDFSQVKRFL